MRPCLSLPWKYNAAAPHDVSETDPSVKIQRELGGEEARASRMQERAFSRFKREGSGSHVTLDGSVYHQRRRST